MTHRFSRDDSNNGKPLLEVRDLKVQFPTPDGLVKAVDGVSFKIHRGETLGVVGESGSGKSVTFLTVMGLISSRDAHLEGEVMFKGRDLLKLPEVEMRHIRGKEMGMVFQDPMTSLHPMYRVGYQIAEAVLAHEATSKKAAWGLAVALLGRGGSGQGAMIALTPVPHPDLLIADEPTTALDVTVQAQILDLIDRLKTEFNAAVAIITHDLGVVAEHCERIQVMYAGRVTETGTGDDLFYRGHHPYTWGLLQSIPRLDAGQTQRLLPIKGLPPSLIFVPPGCAFHPRCPYVMDVCRTEIPTMRLEEGEHAAACHLSSEEQQRIFTEKVLQQT